MRDDEFFLHASDKKGHSVKLTVRVPPEVDHAIQEVFDRHKFPFTTRADIIRDAIVHRLDWYKNQVPEIETDLARLQAIKRILDDEEYRSSFLKSLDTLSQQVNWLLGQGDEASKEHAEELVYKVYEEVLGMKGYWHDKGLAMLKERFAGLLKRWNMADLEEE